MANLIPTPTDAVGAPVDPTSLVTVTTFSRISLPEIAGPSLVDTALQWLSQSWSTLAMIVLALVALMMLRSFVAAVPNAPEMPNVMSATMSNDEEDERSTAAAGNAKEAAKAKPRSLQRKIGTGPSLREELIDMVREDPEAAANVLRGWIGNAT